MKKMLNEESVRRFAELTGQTITEQRLKEMGYDEPEEELNPEPPMDDKFGGGEEPPMGDMGGEPPMGDLGGEPPMDDGLGMEDELGLNLGEEEKEQVMATIVDAVAEALGVDADVETEDDMLPVDDLEPEAPAPELEPEEEELPPLPDDEDEVVEEAAEPVEEGAEPVEESQEAMIQEVTKRVLKRLIAEAKQRKAAKKAKPALKNKKNRK